MAPVVEHGQSHFEDANGEPVAPRKLGDAEHDPEGQVVHLEYEGWQSVFRSLALRLRRCS